MLPSQVQRHRTMGRELLRTEFDVTAALTRRRLLGMGAGTVVGASLVGCAPDQRSRGRGTWSYTDVRGKRITLDRQPERIVAYSSIVGSLAGYGVRFAGVYGNHEPVDGKPNPLLGGASLDGISKLTGSGEFVLSDPEKVIAANPDLVLEKALGDPAGPFAISKEAFTKLEPVVPVALLDVAKRTLPDLLEDFAELARRLGGDPDSDEVAVARKDFTADTDAIERTLAGKPRFRVLMISGTPQNAYLFRSTAAPATRYLTEHGMELVDPGKQAEDDFFVELSWEDFGDVEADVIWYDARGGTKALRQLMSIPTFRNHPAVRADQVVPLILELPLSYPQWSKEMNTIAGWTDRFRKL